MIRPSVTAHLQTPAIVDSSSSSTQQQLVDGSSVVPPSRTSAFTPVMQQQQQVTDSSVAPPSRISAFTPVVSGYPSFSFITSPTSTESHNQLLRSSYEQMPSEQRVYTTSNENQICTYSSTIVQERQQDQGTRPVRRSKRLRKQLQKIEEDSKRGLQSQEAVGSSSSLPNETKSKNVETNTQQVQEGDIETSSSPSPLAIVQLILPSGDGDKHVTITDEQKDELVRAIQQEHQLRRFLRPPFKTTEKITKKPPLKAQHGRSDVLTVKNQKALLRYNKRREETYQEHVNMRKEHLEINRWLDSMEKDNPLKVRRTFNAYNNIPLEKTLNEEERKAIEEEERKGTNERKRKAICLDHINQQKQKDQSSDGIFAGLLKKIGLGKE
ncbi:hypothetical protein INT45_006805 [Circinella minor]|uniref:Uncharacterized protein n=1 Tax=Circinella minor TaxID=1195481 RepID=A0A8H7RVZ5_9FUNG|nr:hypothetical protein INT45_006805 [Circinella minor]